MFLTCPQVSRSCLNMRRNAPTLCPQTKPCAISNFGFRLQISLSRETESEIEGFPCLPNRFLDIISISRTRPQCTYFAPTQSIKGLFTPNESVTITVTLTGSPFDLFDRHCDGQSGLHTHFCPST